MADDTIEEVVCSPSVVATEKQTMTGLDMFDIGITSWEGAFDNLPIPNMCAFGGNGASNSGASDDDGVNPGMLSISSKSSDIFTLSCSPSASSSSGGLSGSSVASPEGLPIDSFVLPTQGLTLIRAFQRIADRIGAGGNMWELDANSPFNMGTATPADQLPAAWRPTPLQVLTKHHPMIDFMPWPNVRERVIGIFSLPDEMRPPNAVGPMALVNLAYDFEHEAEGVRIFGDDPCDPAGWEIGQLFFERWWFLFDRDIISNSNRLRRLRGAPALRMKNT